jgi:hypothetical protein
MIVAPCGAKSGSALVLQDRTGRQRTPSAPQTRRTWRRPTMIPCAWAAWARASRVQRAASASASGRASPRVPSGARCSRPVAGCGQRDDLAALQLPKPPRAPRAGQITQAIQAAGVEAVQPAVDGRWMTAELGGDLAHLGAIPAGGDDAGALQPARRGVAGAGEAADPALLGGVGGWPREQRRQHGFPPASQGTQHIKGAILLHRT